MVRTFALLSEYRARELGLLTSAGELDPLALPEIPASGYGILPLADEHPPGHPLPFDEVSALAWSVGWSRAVAVQTGGDPNEIGEAWLVRALPEPGPRPEPVEPRPEAETEAAAAKWREDGRARAAAEAEIRRRRLEAMAAESRAESESLAGGSALAVAGAL